MRVPKNITRHELIGLDCIVMKASNKNQIGIKGKIIDETMKTIIIKQTHRRTDDQTTKHTDAKGVIQSGRQTSGASVGVGENKRIEKKGAVFRIRLDSKEVDVDGNYLVARPEDRIKKKFSKW